MARKRARKTKSGGFEDAVDLMAKLPWWAGLVLAAMSYVVLSQLSQAPAAKSLQSGQMGGFVAASMLSSLAMVGQFLLPVIGVFGAVGSYLARRRRQALVSHVTHSPSAQSLNGMSWHEFEMLVGEAFRLKGYRVKEGGGTGPDGGVDLVLGKGSETFLVQCKQWKAYSVSVAVVRELYGVMAAQGAAGGFVVTSGRFTANATAFAIGTNITLIDGTQLHGWLKQVRGTASAATLPPPGRFDPPPPPLAASPAAQLMAAAPANPLCPSCGSLMARRKARRGANAGGDFWGCVTFPACKGTLSI